MLLICIDSLDIEVDSIHHDSYHIHTHRYVCHDGMSVGGILSSTRHITNKPINYPCSVQCMPAVLTAVRSQMSTPLSFRYYVPQLQHGTRPYTKHGACWTRFPAVSQLLPASGRRPYAGGGYLPACCLTFTSYCRLWCTRMS